MMPAKNPINIRPDWKTLTPDQLNRFRQIGFILIILGLWILIKYVPTIQIWYKILGALLFGIGVNFFIAAQRFLNK